MTTKDLGSSSYYVIYSANEAQMLDGSGFWSNEAGWTGLEDATLFTEEERAESALPESTGGDAVWQLHEENRTLSLTLSIDITYDLNGESVINIERALDRMCRVAAHDRLMTGGSDAAAIAWESSITINEPGVSQERPGTTNDLTRSEIADFFLQQIESGNLPLEKIVDKLVDYGLMERKDFLAEMSERMQRN